MANMPVAADQIKTKLCQGDNKDCARFMIFSKLGGERVPGDLFPRHVDRARQILAGA